MIGQTISHYRILEKLGEGGMGVVYKAQDLKLDRPVALKFLPSDLTASEVERARFVREAKAVSSLDHPNICTVYEADSTPQGQMFIAMAYYEGSSLNRVIEKGRLSIEEALRIVIHVAEGLQAAHEKKIVHRDVKPGNIIVTTSAQVKLVDFGLASQLGRTKLTRTHATIGTAAYMSPEQATGEGVDYRSDLWSLGVVLYEMVTGSLPFRGEHEAAIMYSIVNEEPRALEQKLKNASPELQHIVGRALEKDPAERYQSAADMLIDLKRLKKDTSRTAHLSTTVRGTIRKMERRKRLMILSTVLVLIVAAVVILFFPSRQLKLNSNRNITVLPLPTTTINYSRLSHDGNWVAFAGRDNNGKWDIYIMNSSGGDIKRITSDTAKGTSIPGVSDISLDGSRVIFNRRSPQSIFEVASVPSLGGTIRTLTSGMMAKFSGDHDRLLYLKVERAFRSLGQVWSMKLDGSDDHIVYKDTLTPYGYISHSPSPDGNSFAWIRTSPDYTMDLVIIDLEGNLKRQVTSTNNAKDEVYWTKYNHLIYSSFAHGNFDLWTVPAEGGVPQQLTMSRQDEVQAQLSDDGRRLLYYERSSYENIKSLNLETGAITPITNDDNNRGGLIVSPDGRHFVYSYSAAFGGAGGKKHFLNEELFGYDKTMERPAWTIVKEKGIGPRSWSPDGKWIAYVSMPDSIGKEFALSIISPFEGGRPRVLAKRPDFPLLRWMDNRTLGWFADMKTWVCAIDTPEARQFFEDSTNAFPVQRGRSVLFSDRRIGRQGWWLASVSAPSTKAARLFPEGTVFPFGRIDPEHIVTVTPDGTIQKTTFSNGKTTKLKGKVPSNWTSWTITRDLKTVYGLEVVNTNKLILWDNPFVLE